MTATQDRALRREMPWLALAVALLVVLLQANAPEMWFWFAALLVLLVWRSLACRARRRCVQSAAEGAAASVSSTSGSDTGAPG